jgi:uncharacterized protein YndB with AHSA1/START domain
MTGGTASVVVRADAAQVWEMVADVTRIGEWSPEAEGAAWLDGSSAPVVGARFKGRNRRGRARWSTVCEVIEAEPGRSFAFAVGSAAKPQTVWRYQLAPLADGVEVTESFELVKPLGALSRLVTRMTTGVKDRRADLEEGARATLSSLKEAAEAAR